MPAATLHAVRRAVFNRWAVVRLRLRYEIRREIAPYVGLHWERKFGQTADFARQRGVDASELAIVVGIHAWF